MFLFKKKGLLQSIGDIDIFMPACIRQNTENNPGELNGHCDLRENDFDANPTSVTLSYVKILLRLPFLKVLSTYSYLVENKKSSKVK